MADQQIKQFPDAAFYNLTLDVKASATLDALNQVAKLVRKVSDNATVSENGDRLQDVLQGLSLGIQGKRHTVRFLYDEGTENLLVQANDGTDASKTWRTIATIDPTNGDLTATGILKGDSLTTVDGGATLAGNLDMDDNAIVNVGQITGTVNPFGKGGSFYQRSASTEWNVPTNLGTKNIVFKALSSAGRDLDRNVLNAFVSDNTIDFYFDSAQSGQAIFGTGQTGAASFAPKITVSDGDRSDDTQRLTFAREDFYITTDNCGDPQINLVQNDITLQNLGSGEGVGDAVTDGVVRLKSIVAGPGVTVGSDGEEITVSAPENAAGTFYGVVFQESTSGGFSERDDVLVVDSDHFYMASAGDDSKPLITLQENQTFSVANLREYLDLQQTGEPADPTGTETRLWTQAEQGRSTLKYKDTTGINIELSRDNVIVVRNDTGSQIDSGKAVYISGATGNIPQVSLAQADSASTLPAIGITIEDLADNDFGLVLQLGTFSGIDLSSFSDGDTLYVSASSAGELTATKPSHPNLVQIAGIVASNGVSGELIAQFTAVEGDESGTAQGNFTVGTTAAGSMVLTPSSTSQRTVTFPDKTGTVAYTDDLDTFYGLTVKQSDDLASFSGLKVVSFESESFYITQNDPNTDEVQVNIRGAVEANTASNLGSGEGVFAQKSGVDLQLKSLVGGEGVSLSSDGSEITIDSPDSFYGLNVKQSDGAATFKGITTVNFGDDFYLTQNSPNTDEVHVNFRGSSGGGLQNVVEDTTPQLGGDLDVNGNEINSPAGDVVVDAGLDVTVNSGLSFDVTAGLDAAIDATGSVRVESGAGPSSNSSTGQNLLLHADNNEAVNLSDGEILLSAGNDINLQIGANERVQLSASAFTKDGVEIATLDDLDTFYGITVKQSDDAAAFRNLNVVSFDANSFYLTQNSPNTDEVQVNLRNVLSNVVEDSTPQLGGHLDVNGFRVQDSDGFARLSLDNSAAALLTGGGGATTFSGGISIVSDGGTATASDEEIALAAGTNITLAIAASERVELTSSDFTLDGVQIATLDDVGATSEFYGVLFRDTDSGYSQRKDALVVDRDDFYLTETSTGQPLLNFIRKAPVTEQSWGDPGANLDGTETIFLTPASGFDTNEANARMPVVSSFRITKMRVVTGGSPGSGNSYTVTLRRNSTDTSLEAVVSDTNTTAVAEGSETFADNDIISVRAVAAGPANNTGSIFVTFRKEGLE